MKGAWEEEEKKRSTPKKGKKWKENEKENREKMKERKWGDRFPNVGNGGRFRVVEGKWEERGKRKKKKRK